MPAKTIFVAGTRRKAGKTLVSSYLLRSLPRTGAIKVTCCRTVGGCPRGKPCGVCKSLSGPFEVVQDLDTLAQPGKDTARLLDAATGKVVWLKSRPEALADGLAAALALFEDERAVLVEGNAAFQAARPDLGLLVTGPGPEPPKPTVGVALPRIDALVLNTRPGSPAPVPIQGLPEEVRTFSFDAANPEGSPEAGAFVQWVVGTLGL